jgi:hypothetical protein
MERSEIIETKKVRRTCVEWIRDAAGKKVKKIVKSKWLGNQYVLTPIMFTKRVVEALEGITKHCYFKNYFKPWATRGNFSKQARANFYSSSDTLIKLNNSSLLETCTKSNQSEEVGHAKMSKSELFVALAL